MINVLFIVKLKYADKTFKILKRKFSERAKNLIFL